jgi:glutamine amidotransferase
MAASSGMLKIPHMGWNSIDIVRSAPLFNGVTSGSHCYFVHSYFVEPKDPGVVASVTDYGGQFVSAIWRDNVVACQFHPEKSQTIGLQVIKNFAAWAL